MERSLIFPFLVIKISHYIDIALKQLKILEICKLFQSIKLQIFCILTIMWFNLVPVVVFERKVLMSFIAKLIALAWVAGITIVFF